MEKIDVYSRLAVMYLHVARGDYMDNISFVFICTIVVYLLFILLDKK